MLAILWHFSEISLLHLKKNGFDLGTFVLEGEVKMAGIGSVQIGNLTSYTDKREAIFQKAADGAIELGNGQDSAVIHTHNSM